MGIGWLQALSAFDESARGSQTKMSESDAKSRSPSSDTRLVDIAAWYRRYGESVYRRCLRITRSQTLALDVTQEVFLRAHRYSNSYRGDVAPVSWLLTIADRCSLDALRKREPIDSAELQSFLHEEQEGPDVVFTRHDLVAKLLAHAEGDVRQMVTLRYFDELSHEQIAQRLGVNEKTVRRKLEGFVEWAKKFVRRP